MNDKTKGELLRELRNLREQIAKFEKSDAGRRVTEERIRESENKYRTLFENATDAIYLIDPDTQRIIDCNSKASRIIGYSIKQIKAMTVGDLHPDEEQDIVSKIFEKVSEMGSLSGISGISLLRKDKKIVPVEINAATLEIGGKKYCLCITRDITEHKKAEENLRYEKNKLISILDSMEDGVYIVNRQYDLEYLNSVLKKEFGAVKGRKCYMYFHNSESECPWCKNKDILEGRSVRWEWFSEKNNRIYDLIDTPIKNPDGSNSKLQISRDITERKKNEDSLRRSEKQFRDLVDNSLVGIYETNLKGDILYVNEALCRIAGYDSPEELMSENVISRYKNKDDREVLIKLLKENGRVNNFEVEVIKKNGDIITVLLNAVFDGNIISGMIMDINKRKLAEKALKESEERYLDLYDNAPDMFVSVNAQTAEIMNCNKTFANAMQYRKDEIIGRPIFDMYYPDCMEEVHNTFRSFVETGEVHNKELQLQRKDGTKIDVSLNVSAVRNQKGNILYSRSVWRDITERKQADKKLINAKEEWEKTFDTIPDLILVVDGQHRILKANKAFAEKAGMKREDLIGRFCFDVMHGSSEVPAHCPHSKTIKDGKEHIREMYEEKLNGFYIVSSSPIYDPDGRSLGIVEVARDITKRKKMEEKLRVMAMTDELTGLFNRRGFFSLSEKHCKLASRTRRKMSLLYVDIDDMKTINDKLGHKAGDQALMDTARILKESFRESDIIARIGGDEFVVLLTEHSESDIEDIIITNIKSNLAAHNKQGLRNYKLSLSMGVVYYDPKNPCSIDNLLTKADAFMYNAKKNHKFEEEAVSSISEKKTESRVYRRFRTGNDYWAEINGSDKVNIKDISVGGLCLRTSRHLAPSSTCKIKVLSSSENIASDGIVVWSYLMGTKTEKGTSLPYYETGLKFIDMNDMSKNSLEKFISVLAD